MNSKRRILLLVVGLFLIAGLLVGGAVTAAYAYRALAGGERPQQLTNFLPGLQGDGEEEVEGEAQAGDTPLHEQGVLLTHVEEGSPAAEAGLRRGSIILAVDGEPVNTPAELRQAIQAHEAGDTITLTTLVCDAPSDIEVTLGSAGPYLGVGIEGGRFSGPAIGVHPFPEIVPGEGFHFDFDGGPFAPGTGIISAPVVIEVIPDAPAAEAGLQPGDLITTVDGEAVDTARQLTDLIGGKAPGDTVELTVERNGTTRTLTVTLGEHPDDAERGYLGIRIGHAVQEFHIEPAPVPGVQS